MSKENPNEESGLIEAIKNKDVVIPGVRMNTAKLVIDYFLGIKNPYEMTIMAMLLDEELYRRGQGRIIGHGNSKRAIFTQQTLFVEAFNVHAETFVLIHNHPTTSCEPDETDYTIMKDLVKKATGYGLVSLMDFVIISGMEGQEEEYWSMYEQMHGKGTQYEIDKVLFQKDWEAVFGTEIK